MDKIELTLETWEAWYDAQSPESQRKILALVDAIVMLGLSVKTACTIIYQASTSIPQNNTDVNTV